MGDDNKKRTVALLGPFVFCQNQKRLDPKISGKTGELLAFLIANEGRYLQRDTLVSEIWGGRNWARGKSSLNTALWRIRKISFFQDFFTLDSCETSLNLKTNPAIEVDIHLLEKAIRKASLQNGFGHDLLSKDINGQLRSAVDKYFGPFLEPYSSNWVLVERERHLNFYIRALLTLIHDAAERRDFEEALEFGMKILAEDPFRESTQREVMWLYVLNGQRAAAILHYRHFRELILSELEIEPLSE
ncbi:MAG: BTAD domain-containing putative transcriptional regulator, partial [Sphingomonadales bacterium]